MPEAPKRVLLLGAETTLGRACAQALAEAGARLTLVSSKPDAEAAFAVQRLARKLSASSQAIDATNETAVRVMVRQVAKEMGGLDATVICVDSLELPDFSALQRFSVREMEKEEGGVFINATRGIRKVMDIETGIPQPRSNVAYVEVEYYRPGNIPPFATDDDVAGQVVAAVAAAPTNG